MGGLLSMWLGFSFTRTYNVIEFVSIKFCQKRAENKRQKIIESKLSYYDSNGDHLNPLKKGRRKHQNINKWHQIKPKVSNIFLENLSQQTYHHQDHLQVQPYTKQTTI